VLLIRREIGDREDETNDYGRLGSLFRSLDGHAKAKECHKKALLIRQQVGDRQGEMADFLNLYELCLSRLVNVSRQKSILKKYLRSQ